MNINIIKQALDALNTARVVAIYDDGQCDVTPSIVRDAITSLEKVIELSERATSAEERLIKLANVWALEAYADGREGESDVGAARSRFIQEVSNFKVQLATELAHT